MNQYEREIERRFQVGFHKGNKLLGMFLKFNSTTMRGVPDRILILPHRVVFIEFKSPTGKRSKAQERMGEELEYLFHTYWIISTNDEVDQKLDLIYEWQGLKR